MALTPAQLSAQGMAQLRAQMAARQAPVQNTMVPTQPGAGQTALSSTPQGAPQGVQQGVRQASQPNTAPPSGAPKGSGQNKPPQQGGALNLNAGQQAQLQRDLNSTNPQTKAAAQKIFAEVLKRDPAAMQQFQQQSAAGGPPLALNAQQQAQLQAGLNSPDPQQRAVAEKFFKEALKRDPNAMRQFANQAGAAGQRKAPGAGNTGPKFEDILKAQFGKDNPFGLRNYDTAVPIQAAEQAAQRMLSENLAGVNARFGGMGTANSDRAALANAQAISDTSTFLGEKVANIKETAFQNDANRAFQAVMGAAQNDNQRSQIAMAMNQMLGQYGTGLTGVGAQETQLPNLSEIIGLLAAFSSAQGGGTSKGSGAQGFGWKR